MNAIQILNNCASFELRGPSQASLTEVRGHNVHIHRETTEWSSVTMGKPVVDNRCSDLSDLYPRPRSVLAAVMDRLDHMDNAKANLKPPGVR